MPDHSSDDIISLWKIHHDAPWPRPCGSHEGPLMTLDTVISGCVMYYLESDKGLDEQRIEILTTCLRDLDGFLQDLPEDSRHYFNRLSQLGSLLLAAHRG
jgi:hypothetical protein